MYYSPISRHSMTRAVLIAFICTFVPFFNIPVFWPILLIYFIVLFTITMKKQITVYTSIHYYRTIVYSSINTSIYRSIYQTYQIIINPFIYSFVHPLILLSITHFGSIPLAHDQVQVSSLYLRQETISIKGRKCSQSNYSIIHFQGRPL